ncbi:RNA polymerase subunit sigma [Mesorhizobium sp. Root552]|uniref:sigma-70 family RNA polymerase sigma factor n=1 Tax=Mesorhizobium sp. Root552 TaxID=1736555 RepID=UPI0007021E7B|nr:sigma-70 family RNA polymerase sigma factor [Mesorhizobium sp. Root552]KQZ32166.1 RNA polymerase subunit sigma [Mesorhizobium sp. Root552]
MTRPDDAELAGLLRAAMAGDERAYQRFLSMVALRVRALARRLTAPGGGVEAEDIVQDTLLAIHLKRHTWRQDEPVLPWIFAIARFKAIDAFRRRGRRVELDIADFSDTLAAPESEAISQRDLGRALDTLSPSQKAVVASVSVEGQSIAETADALGMTNTAVRVALHRGLAAIARRFGER